MSWKKPPRRVVTDWYIYDLVKRTCVLNTEGNPLTYSRAGLCHARRFIEEHEHEYGALAIVADPRMPV